MTRDRLLEAGRPLLRLGELDAVGRVLLRRAADPHPEDQPAAARDLERRGHPGEDRRVAVHHVDHERPDGHAARRRGRHRQDRPALDDRHRPVALADEVVPRPDALVAGGVEPLRALEPPARLGADRPDRDPDRQARRSARSPRLEPRLEQADVLGRRRVAVARGVCSSAARARPSASRSAGNRPIMSSTTCWIRSAFWAKTSSTDRASTASVPSRTPAS